MNNERFDHLLKKYLSAESTLEEEKILFTTKGPPEHMWAWFKYATKTKRKAPTHLKHSILKAIQSQKRKKRQFRIQVSAIAASIILFATLLFNHFSTQKDHQNKNEVMLKEALSMFSDKQNKPMGQKVIYEDDMIVIYLSNK